MNSRSLDVGLLVLNNRRPSRIVCSVSVSVLPTVWRNKQQWTSYTYLHFRKIDQIHGRLAVTT